MYKTDDGAIYLTEGENAELELLLEKYVDSACEAIEDCEVKVFVLREKFIADFKDYLGMSEPPSEVSIFCPEAISEPLWHGVWASLDDAVDELDDAAVITQNLLGYL